MKSIVLIFSICSVSILAGKGIDIAEPSDFKCFASQGYSWAIIRAYRSIGALDTNAAKSIQAAKAAGISKVDVYMFPCSHGKSAQAQVDEFTNGLASDLQNLGAHDDVFESKGMNAGRFEEGSPIELSVELM